MITACRKEDGTRIFAHEENKENKYEYVDSYINNQPVILCQGEKKIDHFRYHPNVPEDKRIYENESCDHELTKLDIFENIRKHNDIDPLFFNIEHHYRFGRIADVGGIINYIPLAIEIVKKHTDFTDYKNKVNDYHKHGIFDLWVFCSSCFDFEKGYGFFKDILKDVQHRYGFIPYYDLETQSLKTLTMTNPATETMYYYDKCLFEVSFDIESLKNVVINKKTNCAKENFHHELALTPHYENLEAEQKSINNDLEKSIQSLKIVNDRLRAEETSLTNKNYNLKYPSFEFELNKLTIVTVGEEITNSWGNKTVILEVQNEEFSFPKKVILKNYHKQLQEAFNGCEGMRFQVTLIKPAEQRDNGYYTETDYSICLDDY